MVAKETQGPAGSGGAVDPAGGGLPVGLPKRRLRKNPPAPMSWDRFEKAAGTPETTPGETVVDECMTATYWG